MHHVDKNDGTQKTCVLGRKAVVGRSRQDGMPLLKWGVLHERKDPIMEESPHSGRGGTESLCILVGQENAVDDVYACHVMCESVAEKAAFESSRMAGFHRGRDHRNIRCVHEPSLCTERP